MYQFPYLMKEEHLMGYSKVTCRWWTDRNHSSQGIRATQSLHGFLNPNQIRDPFPLSLQRSKQKKAAAVVYSHRLWTTSDYSSFFSFYFSPSQDPMTKSSKNTERKKYPQIKTGKPHSSRYTSSLLNQHTWFLCNFFRKDLLEMEGNGKRVKGGQWGRCEGCSWCPHFHNLLATLPLSLSRL